MPNSEPQIKDIKLFRQRCCIDGVWERAVNDAVLEVHNPATGELLGTVPSMGVVETRHAIEAAQLALPKWRAKTAKERAVILRRWFELIMENQDDLARLMTLEQGKPLIFGEKRNQGIILQGTKPEVVTIGEQGVTKKDLVKHDMFR